jgi:leader peptidase (prepilin peptidase)/N-methyltransferase
MVISSVALAPAAWAVVSDLRSRSIPNLVVALCAVIPVVMAAIAVASGELAVAGTIVLGGALMAAPLLAVHLTDPSWLGFGDVKLAAALGASIAIASVHIVLPALLVASAVSLLAAAVCRRSTVPFAPGLVTGAVLTLIAYAAGLPGVAS